MVVARRRHRFCRMCLWWQFGASCVLVDVVWFLLNYSHLALFYYSRDWRRLCMCLVAYCTKSRVKRKYQSRGHRQEEWTHFYRGQFWPSGIVVVCVCLCLRPPVCVCGNHVLVCAITHHPFKLGSTNLYHRCKRPWGLLTLTLTLTFKVKFNFKIKICPILSLSAR